MLKVVREKCGKLCISSILSPKGTLLLQKLIPIKTLEVDLQYRKTKSCAKFQLNMSKRVREKCRKLYLQYSKFEKRHNSKIDAN